MEGLPRVGLRDLRARPSKWEGRVTNNPPRIHLQPGCLFSWDSNLFSGEQPGDLIWQHRVFKMIALQKRWKSLSGREADYERCCTVLFCCNSTSSAIILGERRHLLCSTNDLLWCVRWQFFLGNKTKIESKVFAAECAGILVSVRHFDKFFPRAIYQRNVLRWLVQGLAEATNLLLLTRHVLKSVSQIAWNYVSSVSLFWWGVVQMQGCILAAYLLNYLSRFDLMTSIPLSYVELIISIHCHDSRWWCLVDCKVWVGVNWGIEPDSK